MPLLDIKQVADSTLTAIALFKWETTTLRYKTPTITQTAFYFLLVGITIDRFINKDTHENWRTIHLPDKLSHYQPKPKGPLDLTTQEHFSHSKATWWDPGSCLGPSSHKGLKEGLHLRPIGTPKPRGLIGYSMSEINQIRSFRHI